MRRICLFVMMLSPWFLSVSEGDAAAPPALPKAIESAPAPEWNAKFSGTEGWIGGDGAYSVALGPNRVLWLFGDTLLGTARDSRRNGAVMVNNTLGVQTGTGKDATIHFVSGKTTERKPAAFFMPADGTGWFWTQAAIRGGKRLFVFLPQINKTRDPGAFGFKHIGQWLAVVENPDAEPEKWRVRQHKVPFADFGPDRERSWGSALLEEGGYLYVYGYEEKRGQGLGKRQLTVARVPAEKLDDFGAWRFRTAAGWSDKPDDALLLAKGLATEFSVSRLPGGKHFVMVYTENGLSDRVVGRFATTPEGPWSAPMLLFKCPEMSKDKGLFSYAAKAHPWAASGNELLVSYCVNSFEFARLFRDDAIYRPKFVRVKLEP